MAKRLAQWIADEEAKKKEPGAQFRKAKGDKNRAEFLAVRDEIAEALEIGWSIRKVWAALVKQKKISMSYDPFTKYIKQLIVQPASVAPSTEAASQSPPQAPQSEPPKPVQVTPESPAQPPVFRPAEPGFRLNTTPNKEDLL